MRRPIPHWFEERAAGSGRAALCTIRTRRSISTWCNGRTDIIMTNPDEGLSAGSCQQEEDGSGFKLDRDRRLTRSKYFGVGVGIGLAPGHRTDLKARLERARLKEPDQFDGSNWNSYALKYFPFATAQIDVNGRRAKVAFRLALHSAAAMRCHRHPPRFVCTHRSLISG